MPSPGAVLYQQQAGRQFQRKRELCVRCMVPFNIWPPPVCAFPTETTLPQQHRGRAAAAVQQRVQLWFICQRGSQVSYLRGW